ncbi:MAG: CPBP family intramembrane metalloprotease [Anaeroplasmataceae bacterium]|nr:CPBP family intramembrane metalloprotease [Anaeroplasmataceae bacterium]
MKKIVAKFPIVFSIFLFAIAMPLVWGVTYPLLYKLPFYWASAIKYTITLVVVIAVCFIVYHKIPFTLQCKGLFKGLFTVGLVGLICAVMAFIFSYDKPDITPTVSIIIGFIFYNLAIAVSEEFLFRGVMFTQMLDSWKNKKNFIWVAIILSSIIFGLRHFLNLITTPNTLVTTIGQVLFTFMAGFYLCAVYLRTRNIWVCIIIHFLEDLFTGFWGVVSSSAAIAQTVDGTIGSMVMLVAIHSVYVIFGIIILKSKKWKYQSLTDCKEEVCIDDENSNDQ